MLQSPVYKESLVALVVNEAPASRNGICSVAYIVSLFIVMHILCRGETFRKDFQNIGEARSLVPDHVSILALTTAVTKKNLVKSVTVM